MINNNAFYKLSPFIQDYIYKNKWEELREIQVEACDILFNTANHLIISSGTASGKTEAAFFPILTEMYTSKCKSIHTLYISPLKALINDQFSRLNELIEETDIKIHSWHGDISQTEKNKVLKNPNGVLQITPESLEAILINRGSEVHKLFSDLKYVVIDEIHAFMGSDRGSQVICLLSRIQDICNIEPRRIGLSATLGNYDNAVKWISSGTKRKVSLIQGKSSRDVFIGVEHFKNYNLENVTEESNANYDYIYKHSLNKKCIIFTNNREEAETIIYNLRKKSVKERTPDVYHVHHGSVSAMLRKEAELTLREDRYPAVVAATLTLELGIDIGKLDRIIQKGAPFSCSSFVQRLGRAGRKSGKSEILFVDVEGYKGGESAVKQLPWSLLQTIAVVELYIKDKWIEHSYESEHPYSLLYHQTLSTLLCLGEMTPAMLAKKVLTLPPFKNIDMEDFKTLLLHLIEIEHIEKTETGSLILGLESERIANNFHFYGVFNNDMEYRVMHNSKEIGSITNMPPEDAVILLTGRSWKVIELDLNKKIVHVEPSKGKAKNVWSGNTVEIDDVIINKIKEVILSDGEYRYLSRNAKLRLDRAREIARTNNLFDNIIISSGEKSYYIMPWLGTKKINTIYNFFQYYAKKDLEIISVSKFSSYYIYVESRLTRFQFVETISRILKGKLDLDRFFPKEGVLKNKYDQYLPKELILKEYVQDEIDINAIELIKHAVDEEIN